MRKQFQFKRAPFSDATHRLPNSITRLLLVLTEKVGHILLFLLLTARCNWKEEKPLKHVEINVTCYLAEAARALIRPWTRSVPRWGQRTYLLHEAPAPGTSGSCCPPRSTLPGPFLPQRPPPERPPPPRGTLSAGCRHPRYPQPGLSRYAPPPPPPLPGSAPLLLSSPPTGTPLPESAGGGAGAKRDGEERGSLRPRWEPLRPSPTFPEAETAAAGAAHRVPGQGDSPRPSTWWAAFPSPPLPARLALPRPPPPRRAPPAPLASLPCAAPPASGGGRQPPRGPAPPLPPASGRGPREQPAEQRRSRRAGPGGGGGSRRRPQPVCPAGRPAGPRRRHGAQPAAPLRGREWGPGGREPVGGGRRPGLGGGRGLRRGGGGAGGGARPWPCGERAEPPSPCGGRAAEGPRPVPRGRPRAAPVVVVVAATATGRVWRVARHAGAGLGGFGSRVGPARAGFRCNFSPWSPTKL